MSLRFSGSIMIAIGARRSADADGDISSSFLETHEHKERALFGPKLAAAGSARINLSRRHCESPLLL